MNKHLNIASCFKCQDIAGKFPGLHQGLFQWFLDVRAIAPDAHLSCAGRGRADQDRLFKSGYSRAVWLQSAHNFNVAIDFFRLTQQGLSYDPTWFKNVIGDAVHKHNADIASAFKLKWYGDPGVSFFELPHVEIEGWRELNLKPVEPGR